MNGFRWIMLLTTVCTLGTLSRFSEARPGYSKTFASTYAKEYESRDINTRACTVCHDKTNAGRYRSNNYADALYESLQNRKGVDETVLASALRETESKPSAIEGKTFGDLIREGRLPASR